MGLTFFVSHSGSRSLVGRRSRGWVGIVRGVGGAVDDDSSFVDKLKGEAGAAQQLVQRLFRGEAGVGAFAGDSDSQLGAIDELVARRFGEGIESIGQGLGCEAARRPFGVSSRDTQDGREDSRNQQPQCPSPGGFQQRLPGLRIHSIASH
jgi:hypothetical protein